MNRIGVDVGGTFTDLILVDSEGDMHLWKVPSTPDDPSRACLTGTAEIIELANTSPEAIDLYFHGTTIATNIVLEHAGAKAGMITTKGFRDLLHIARHKRPLNYSLSQEVPWQAHPLVERVHRLPVSERIGAPDGQVLVPLDEDEVRAAARELAREEVEAVSICFLFAFLNPAHELRAAEIVREEMPDVFLSLSHQVVPTYREYERFSTTALNSHVGPKTARYLDMYSNGLKQQGINCDLRLMQSSGGVVSEKAASSKPATLLTSGVVAGLIGGIYTANQDGFESSITLDIGGTSADIGVAPSGKAKLKHLLDSEIGGYDVMLPMLDVDTIGAGGGSIAYIDSGGMFRVGPRSAGAVPGPAAYCKGGTLPTVTDANVVLGRLIPDSFLGGRMTLDPERSVKAISEHIAEPLGISIEEAALGILKIVNHNMSQAIEVNSVRKGFDPRDFALVGFGGGGPSHACEVAAGLRIPTVILPPAPGITSALGLLVSDVKYEASQSLFQSLNHVDVGALAERYRGMEQEVTEQVLEDNILQDNMALLREVECRYVGQGYELRVPFPAGEISKDSLQQLMETYHQYHEREYACRFDDSEIEIINIHCTGTGSLGNIGWKKLEQGGEDASAARVATIKTTFEEQGKPVTYDAGHYERDRFKAGNVFEGPAIITQLDTTSVIPPGFVCTVSESGNIIVKCPE